MVKKKPYSKVLPSSLKHPRIDPNIEKFHDEKPSWQIGILDVDGNWGWKNLNKDRFFIEFLPKLKNFESMFWKDILGRNNHEVRINQISKPAQKRLSELKLDDFETIVSLRFTGSERLWGLRLRNVLRLLWWDPDHEVFPSQLKHTYPSHVSATA